MDGARHGGAGTEAPLQSSSTRMELGDGGRGVDRRLGPAVALVGGAAGSVPWWKIPPLCGDIGAEGYGAGHRGGWRRLPLRVQGAQAALREDERVQLELGALRQLAQVLHVRLHPRRPEGAVKHRGEDCVVPGVPERPPTEGVCPRRPVLAAKVQAELCERDPRRP